MLTNYWVQTFDSIDFVARWALVGGFLLHACWMYNWGILSQNWRVQKSTQRWVLWLMLFSILLIVFVPESG